LNKTKSILGKQRLKEWISRPITNKQMIEERHSTVEFFLRPDIREELQELRDYLSQIRNIHRLLPKIREHKALSNDWQYILKVKALVLFGSCLL
jgi:DNA mismatch repair protein MSH5